MSGLAPFFAGDYDEAQARFRLALGAARSVGDVGAEGRAYTALGAVSLTLHHYNEALDEFLHAERDLRMASDPAGVAWAKANVGSLYSDLGDVDRAATWVDDAMHGLHGADLTAHLPQMQLQLAILRAQQKDRFPEALDLFWRVIEASYRARDWDTYGKAWNRLGDAYLLRQDLFGENTLALAEKPLEEALKIRTERHLPPDTAYRSLGCLRLKQGRTAEAIEWLDRAIALANRPNSGLPAWDVYFYRAAAKMQRGDLPGSLDDYEVAVRLARNTLRHQVPPDEQARLAEEGKTRMGRIHAGLVDAAGLLYQKTGQKKYLVRAFETAEENRAFSLLSPAHESLPESYWKALDELGRAENAALKHKSPAPDAAAQGARDELAAIEGSLASASKTPAGGLLRAMQSQLDSETALLSFSEGQDCVWMWAVDRSGADLYRLPSASRIQSLDELVLAGIARDSAGIKPAGAQLYAAVFGQLAPRYRAKRRWLLALDESLFSIPVAALPDGPNASAPYIIERRTVEVVPGAAHWLAARRKPRPALAPVMVALGDPIYNSADPRLKSHPAKPSASLFQLTALESDGLPRLVASAQEIDLCARNWKNGTLVLEGEAASRESLLAALSRNPAAVHLATHVVNSPATPPEGIIALSLGPNGAPELLEPREIASWRIEVGLVTMSGCASASPQAVRAGSGLMGLTRSWLAAGARHVIASRWSMPDDNGALFASLYRALGANQKTDPASALRDAQVEMLHSHDWRSQPRYWGAYFAVGKE